MDRISYLRFNLIIAGIIAVILLYAGFFCYSNHSVACAYKAATGLDCPTCGLTRSFHAFLTGNWSRAMTLNKHALLLFSFFALQLLLRVLLLLLNKKLSLYRTQCADLVFSATLFLVCFCPLIIQQFAA